MLTADQISFFRDRATQLTTPISEFLVADIARRISEAGQLTSTAAYQVWRMQNLGVSLESVKKGVQKRLGVSVQELERLLTQAAEVGYNFDLSRLPTDKAIPFAENAAVQQIVAEAVKAAQDDLTNMVQTIGFINADGKARTLTQAYQQACDTAFMRVSTGAQDYTSAIRDATRELANRGIVTIDYESGVHTSMEAAVRRNLMGGMGLMQEQISHHNHDTLGCDGWEISAHGASAPDHEPFQGRQYSDAAFQRLNSSLVRRIGTLNCGHAASPIILGVNSPQYSRAELEQLRRENEAGITYQGRHYSTYEATQKQRQLEAAIRKQKRRILVDESTGDSEKLPIDQTRLVRYNDEYLRFSRAAGLRTQRQRAQIPGFGVRESRNAKETAENVFKNPPKDLKKMSRLVDKALGKYCKQSSKWSGETIIQPRINMLGVAGRKEWNCDITLRDDAGVKTVVHEHLHARSVSYFDPKVYIRHRKMEEGTVELFAQEICRLNGVEFSGSYSDCVKPLQISNSIMRIGDGYSFAKQLFDIPLPERYNWLREKADALIATGKLSKKTVESLKAALETLRGKDV